MRPILTLAMTFALSLPLAAQNADGAEPPIAEDPVAQWNEDSERIFAAEAVDLADFQWRLRPLVVFADSEFDPAFREQIELLQAEIARLIERDVIIIADSDPSLESQPRTQLRPRGFALVLVGKDGRVAFRKPSPWNVREITRAIDKMPLRQQEISGG